MQIDFKTMCAETTTAGATKEKQSMKSVIPMLLMAVILLPSLVWADDFHYVNMLIGNRASGMGGAYTALSDDPAGCFYNPAGIAFVPHSSLSASVNAFAKSTKTYENALTNTDGRRLDWRKTSSSLLPNFFGLVRDVGGGKLGLSYAVTDSLDRRQKQTFHDIRSHDPANPIDTYAINLNNRDETYLFGPSYAHRLTEALSLGVTLYAYYRDKEIINNQLLTFSQGQHYWSNYYETQQDWGVRPMLGLVWEPWEKVALGASVSRVYILSSDKTHQTTLRDTVSTGTTEVGGQEIDFSDTDAIFFNSGSSHDTDDFPYRTALGVAYFVSPRLLFTVDGVYHNAVDEKEAVWNFALGTEYYPWESVALRGGLFSDHANTAELSADKVNQMEHLDIYGASLSVSLFHHQSSVTLGTVYSRGEGEAQAVADSTVRQDVTIENLNFYLSASYRF
jgi:long-chain fatty acid transport protein